MPRVTEEEMLAHLSACKKRFPSRLVGTSFIPLPPPGDAAAAGAAARSEGEGEGEEEEDEGRGGSSSSSLTLYRRLWHYLLQRCSIPTSTPWARLSNRSLSLLASALIDCPVEVVGRGEYRDEFVTAGGVPLNEVDFKTLESKVCPGLFLCGELLDIDGVTGGYNFQSSWSTGFVGGTAAGTVVE
jgi:predicted flavoprotein YhiN